MIISHDRLESKLLNKYFSLLVKSDALLKDIEMYRDIHVGGTRYQTGAKEITVPKAVEDFAIEVKRTDIENFEIETFSAKIYDFTMDRIMRMHKELLGSLEKVTQFTGNVVSGGGKPISPDLFLDALEKIWIEFDEEGEPIKYDLVCGPEVVKQLQKCELTEAHKKRYEMINREEEKGLLCSEAL